MKDAGLLLIGMEKLSHHSRSRSPSPDTVPPILTPLRAWLRKRVPFKGRQQPFSSHIDRIWKGQRT